LDLSTIIQTVNQYGAARKPFLLIADFELQQTKVIPLEDLPEHILYDINGQTNQSVAPHKLDINLSVRPFPFDQYYKAFDQVMDELLAGNTFLINLTAKHEIQTSASLTDIFRAARAKYKLLIKDRLVVFSPETFVTIKGGKVSSYPMKGTIDANLKNAKQLLLDNDKETAEHYTIIDLIRNDLSIYSDEVRVEKLRFLDLIQSINKDLYQMSSEITGQLSVNYHEQLGDIVFSMLPAGSISGAPKAKTVAIIQAAESEKRGYYTGVCGIYDGNDFDSFVMIRYIDKVGQKLYYRSGGGITALSQVEQEYQEMIDKIYIPTA